MKINLKKSNGILRHFSVDIDSTAEDCGDVEMNQIIQPPAQTHVSKFEPCGLG